MSVATTDAFRNFAVLQPGAPDVTTTVAAEIVGDTLTLVAGFGITLVADPATDKITINNTGNGTGAYTEITDSNANLTFYPLFSRPFQPTDINPLDTPPSYQLDTIYVDNTTSPMTYNPSTGTLTAVNFSGNLSGNANTVTNGVYTSGSYSDPSWLTISKSFVGLGNVENTALSTSTFNIGTTSITFNRASAAQTLNGVSIDGNAGTVTNGVYTNGSYSDPTWLTISKSFVGLGNVENTALSTWTGSSSITTVGTLTNLSVTNTITGSVNGNAGTVTNGFYTTSSFNLGTTSIAVNRASAAQSLTGISIDGSAGKATNLIGGNNTTLLGSIPYQSNTDTTTLLSPNTTTTKKFLRQTGDGTNGAVPVWDTPSTLTISTGLSGTSYNGTGDVTIAIDSTVVTLTGTQTLSNKRVTPRVGLLNTSGTLTVPTDDYDLFDYTLNNNSTFNATVGTPQDGQRYTLRIRDDGTARTISWNSLVFREIGVTLPSTTVVNKTTYIGMIYNAVSGFWDVIAVGTQA